MGTVQNTSNVISPDLLNSVNPKKATAAEGSVEADTNKFLTLLVTQLKNQDPMNPLDNAQITSQLAQLSTVTGVNKLNTTLESLKASYQSSESMQATNMIGHGVLVAGKDVELIKGEGIMGVEVNSPADKVTVIITDPKTGKDIQSMDLGPQQPGIIPIMWDGVPDKTNLDPDGKPITMKDGKYLIRVVADKGGETLKDAKALSFDSVLSVSNSAKDGVRLNLSTGIVTMADIKQIL